MSAAAPTDLPTLAIEINGEIEAAERDARSAVEHARRAGKLLLEAKGRVAHGEWLPWLRAHCRAAERTAQAYMRLARRLAELPEGEAQRVADLPLRGALALFAEPRASEGDYSAPSPTPCLDGFRDVVRLALEDLSFLVGAAGAEDLRALGRIASGTEIENVLAEVEIFSARMVGMLLRASEDGTLGEDLDREHRAMQERCLARANGILDEMESIVGGCSPLLRGRLEQFRGGTQRSDDALLPPHALRFHEFADVCPLMADDEIKALARAIGEMGLLRPITVYRGKILDGRCRALAFARHPELAPASAWREQEFKGTDEEALDYVESMNLRRANYSSDEVAEILRKAADLKAREVVRA